MITSDIIKASVKDGRLTLKAKTQKCSYSQVYNLVKICSNYVHSIDEAIEKFIRFYNQFE